MSLRSIRYLLAGSALAALTGASAPALAQAKSEAAGSAQIEEIVVTAQKRSENLRDVPISITAYSGDTLDRMQIKDVSDLSGASPSLQVRDAANAFFIRGVGLNDFAPNTSGAVSIYRDGAFLSSPYSQRDLFYDVQQVEVLRGPQGTLYGRNTTGGAINLTTRRPTFTLQSNGSIDYGTFNTVNAEAGVGGPLIADKLAIRIAGAVQRDDGTVKNRVTGHDVNATDKMSGRISLLFTPSDSVEMLGHVQYTRDRSDDVLNAFRGDDPQTPEATGPDGLCTPASYFTSACTNAFGYAGTGNAFVQDLDLEGVDHRDIFNSDLSTTIDFNGMSLVSVTALQRTQRHNSEDTDASPAQLFESDYRSEQHDVSQELRLQSNAKEGLHWVAGVYYQHSKVATENHYDILRALRPLFITPSNPTGFNIAQNVVLVGYPFQQKTDSLAAFGQVDYPLTSRLTLTGGLRWSQDKKTYHYESTIEDAITVLTADESKTFNSISGRLGLKYDISDKTNVYASYNRGYKSGGFFGGYTSDINQLKPYDDETIDSYEAGVKSQMLDGRILLSASTFYYDYKNLQVFSIIDLNGVPTSVLDNASDAEIYGAELEVQAHPLQGLDISSGLSLLHATYKNYESFGQDYSGNRQPNAPKVSFNTTLNYVRPAPWGGDLEANLFVTYRSKVFYDTSNLERLSSGGLWLTNARLGWSPPNAVYTIGVFAKNLFNEKYFTDANALDSFGFDALSFGRPRVAGVYARYKF